MTKEEAIKWLKQIKNVGYQENLLNHSEAIDMAIKALEQKLLVIEYKGTEHRTECESFEFRTNQVSNWIRIKHSDGIIEMIHDVCVIKAESEEQ